MKEINNKINIQTNIQMIEAFNHINWGSYAHLMAPINMIKKIKNYCEQYLNTIIKE